MARTPGPANATYGFANWFLNTGRKPLPDAPAIGGLLRGQRRNIIYIDWDHDIVAVVRWIGGDARAERLRRQDARRSIKDGSNSQSEIGTLP